MLQGLLLVSERPGRPVEVYSMAAPTPEPWGKDAVIAVLAGILPLSVREFFTSRRRRLLESSAIQVERLRNEPTFAKMFEELADKRLSESNTRIDLLTAEIKEARSEILNLRVEIGVQTGLTKAEAERNERLRNEVIALKAELIEANNEREALRAQVSVLQDKAGVRQGERRSGAVPQQVEVINTEEHPVPVIDPQK